MSKKKPPAPDTDEPLSVRIFRASGIVAAVNRLRELGKPPTVRVFTKAEVRARRSAARADIKAKMAALKKQWEDSKGTDQHALLGALIFVAPQLPEWVFMALKQLIIKPMPQEPPLHWGRWLRVHEGRANGLSWRKAQEYASNYLENTPYAGSSRAMRKSYDLVQRLRRGKKQVAPFRS